MNSKQKVKIIEVDACCNCPFLSYEQIGENEWDWSKEICEIFDFPITNDEIVHPDCKLKDK